MPVYPVPPRDDPGLGIHITPTLEGHVLLGPSAESIADKSDLASTRAVAARLQAEAGRLVPGLAARSPSSTRMRGSGPSSSTPSGGVKLADFVVEESARRPGWMNLVGIESPGLTAAPAIAGWSPTDRGEDGPPAEAGFRAGAAEQRRFAALDDGERARARRRGRGLGRDDLPLRARHPGRGHGRPRNPFGARTLDAVKRRTRCGMGRCQGGFCTPRLVDILQEEGVPADGSPSGAAARASSSAG